MLCLAGQARATAVQRENKEEREGLRKEVLEARLKELRQTIADTEELARMSAANLAGLQQRLEAAKTEVDRGKAQLRELRAHDEFDLQPATVE